MTGLVVDNQDLHSDRIKLWNEFNRCWLSALQRQKEMTQGMLDTGQPPPLPQSLIQEDFLERMGSQLVRLCDNMERHGLVDYQMGVWEEEIISSEMLLEWLWAAMVADKWQCFRNALIFWRPTMRRLAQRARRV